MSREAEQSVLGGCMLDASAYWRVADLLTAEDFSEARHSRLWTSIGELVRAGEAADSVTLAENSDFGSYAIQLANATPSAANIRAYAGIVAKHAQHRRVIQAGAKIAKLSADDALGEAQKLLGEAARTELAAIRPAREVLADFVEDLQRKCDADSAITGLSTGFTGIDDITAGFQPGDLIVVAGRPSMGKSTIAQNIAERVALRGERVLFFSQEMTAANVLARCVSSIGCVPFDAIRSPKLLDESHWLRIGEAGGKLKAAPLLFDESCGITVEQVCARGRQCHGGAKLSLIVIDYLQYLRMPKADTHALAVQEVTRDLKGLAKALQVPVLLVSQLNRGVESRADKRPTMSDLRDSGAIEQDADVIAFCYRDGYYHAKSAHKGFAEFIIAKQRNGRTGMVPLLERLDQMRFEDCDGLPEEVPHETPTGRARGFSRFGGQTDRKQASAG